MKAKIVALALMANAGAATVAAAQPPIWDGYVGGAYGSTQFGFTSGSTRSDWLAEGRATFEHEFAGNIGVQADGVFHRQNFSVFQPDLYLNAIDVALHAFYREPGQWLFGPFVQFEQINARQYSNSYSALSQTWAGLEAQGYWNNVSLYVQGAAKSVNLGNTPGTGWTVKVRGRYFFSPQWLIEASAAFDTIHETVGGDTYQTTSLGAATEYKFMSLPLSVFARYSHNTVDFSWSDSSETVDRILFGAKWNFGGAGSLWDRETGGASLDPFDTSVVLRLAV